jgi:hypothetical protein
MSNRLAANRANARKSTGPRLPSGKQPRTHGSTVYHSRFCATRSSGLRSRRSAGKSRRVTRQYSQLRAISPRRRSTSIECAAYAES